jgi:hypothetical protein
MQLKGQSMNTYTVVVTTKRNFKVTAEDEQKAMGKAYQMLMQFKQDDVQPLGDLTMTIELEHEKP